MAGEVKISASLIVKDEEAFLDGCLASVLPHVDEIIVVDTGSSDGSPDIAARFGAKVIKLPWRNDFAEARNAGLDAAGSDWILYIDADERLSVPPGSRLQDNLSGPEAFAARVSFRPTLHGTPFREYRLFRRDPRLRFKGSMHETILPDLEKLRAAGAKVVDSPAAIVHLGYEGDQGRKHLRNLPLLRTAIEENPGRLYYRYHLAETLVGLAKNEEALEVTALGLELARQRHDHDSLRIASLLAQTRARLLIERGDAALPVIEEGLGFYPGNRALLFLKAQAFVNTGEFEQALPILSALTSEDAATFCDPELSYDRRIFGSFAHDLTGVALLRLGRRPEAAAAFASAAAAEPSNPAYRVKAAALRMST